MKNLQEALSIINGSKQYEFAYSHESGHNTILEVTSYYGGRDTLRLDLSRLTPEMLEALQVSDGRDTGSDDYEYYTCISEQVGKYDELGKWCGMDELSIPYQSYSDAACRSNSFFGFLCDKFPDLDWQADDGDDWDEDPDTDFCQYVADINDGKPDHIYLASYSRHQKTQITP